MHTASTELFLHGNNGHIFGGFGYNLDRFRSNIELGEDKILDILLVHILADKLGDNTESAFGSMLLGHFQQRIIAKEILNQKVSQVYSLIKLEVACNAESVME